MVNNVADILKDTSVCLKMFISYGEYSLRQLVPEWYTNHALSTHLDIWCPKMKGGLNVDHQNNDLVWFKLPVHLQCCLLNLFHKSVRPLSNVYRDTWTLMIPARHWWQGDILLTSRFDACHFFTALHITCWWWTLITEVIMLPEHQRKQTRTGLINHS